MLGSRTIKILFLLESCSSPVSKEDTLPSVQYSLMSQHIQTNNWGNSHGNALERMIKELQFGGDEANPTETPERMDIDAPVEVDRTCEPGRANAAFDLEPMEIDQKTQLCMDDNELKQRKLERVTSLSDRLIGHEPIETFVNNCKKTLPGWIELLRKTTLPNGITSADPCIISAFKAVDSVICAQGTEMLQRLANVKLIQLFDSLEDIIKSDRENGRVHREPYYRDANIAMDIYLSAQGARSNTKKLRRKLNQGRKRLGKRWCDLATVSPLFVLVYSNAAESIV